MCLHCYSISLLFDTLSRRLYFLAFILHGGASGILYKFLVSCFIFSSFSLPLRSFKTMFLSTCYLLDTILESGNTGMNKTRKSPAMEFAFSWQLWFIKTIGYNPCSCSLSLFSLTKCFSLKMRIYLFHQPGSATKDTKHRFLILPADEGDLFLVSHLAYLKHTFLTETLE